MSTTARPAPQDRIVRISPNQIMCTISECGKAAKFVLHRFEGSATPARLAYCEHHVKQVASELRVRMPV
jgi:hypothetical protein